MSGEEHLPPGDLQARPNDFASIRRKFYPLLLISVITNPELLLLQIEFSKPDHVLHVENRWFVPQTGFEVRLKKRVIEHHSTN